jgi:hypothetical protein
VEQDPLDKLIVSQLVKKLALFCEVSYSVTMFKALAVCPYPEPD